MNKLVLTLIGCAMAAQIAGAQSNPAPADAGAFQKNLARIVTAAGEAKPADPAPAEPKLQRFDLDFHGGGARAFVAAIEHATGKPINVIIPEHATGGSGNAMNMMFDGDTMQIEPMKLTGVTVPELFDAVNAASRHDVTVNHSHWVVAYSFRNHGSAENPIWVFDAGSPMPDPNICRFYQLGQELKTYSIEDITTAIQIGWKMLGVKDQPALKFHAETKLLIAVGPPELLQTIDSVLSELGKAPRESEPRKNKDVVPAAK